MCSCNAEAPLCVGDAILVVSTYIVVAFLDISWIECLRCSLFVVTLFHSSLYTFFIVIKLPSVNYLLSDLSYVAFSDT